MYWCIPPCLDKNGCEEIFCQTAPLQKVEWDRDEQKRLQELTCNFADLWALTCGYKRFGTWNGIIWCKILGATNTMRALYQRSVCTSVMCTVSSPLPQIWLAPKSCHEAIQWRLNTGSGLRVCLWLCVLGYPYHVKQSNWYIFGWGTKMYIAGGETFQNVLMSQFCFPEHWQNFLVFKETQSSKAPAVSHEIVKRWRSERQLINFCTWRWISGCT